MDNADNWLMTLNQNATRDDKPDLVIITLN